MSKQSDWSVRMTRVTNGECASLRRVPGHRPDTRLDAGAPLRVRVLHQTNQGKVKVESIVHVCLVDRPCIMLGCGFNHLFSTGKMETCEKYMCVFYFCFFGGLPLMLFVQENTKQAVINTGQFL